jgi:puromycin-sensitive aminopeptidase
MVRLDPAVRPLSYDLHVRVDPRKDRFSGTARIELQLDEATDTIEVHAVDLDLETAQAAGEHGPVRIRRRKADKDRESIHLVLARPLPAGRAVLELAWTGPIRDDLRGLYLARSGKRRYAVTQLEATDARRFFPCFDEPDKKATFSLTATVPERYQAIANGAAVSTSKKGSWKTMRFRETPLLSTYLVALVVGELESSRVRRVGHTPIRVWCPPGKRKLTGFALEAAAECLERLEKYFGSPHPYEKLDLIAVPDFEFGAMENAGAVIFRETLLLADPKTIAFGEKKRVAEVVCHELAHMWYGNLVTMAWWDDLWLNEAFATWMAYKIVADWKPELAMWLDFQQGSASAFALDALESTHPIYCEVGHPDEATENFDRITYEKGAAVVRMVERWLGESTFKKGVRRYLKRNALSNARGADLWNALEEVSGEPVEKVVRAWIEAPGFPLVRAKVGTKAGKAVLRLAQERYVSNPKKGAAARKGTWPLPVRARVQPKRGRARVVTGLVTRATGTVELGPADGVRWAYANAEEAGFYRPLHDARTLEAIGADLGRLDPSERMGLVGHQWAGFVAGAAPLGDLLDLALGLGDETAPEVLETAYGPLAWLGDRVGGRLPSKAQERWKAGLAETFAPGFAELGWKPRRGEDERVGPLRAVLLSLAAGLGDDEGLQGEVSERIRPWLKERKGLDPNLAGPLVGLAARTGDEKLWRAYHRVLRSARTPQERNRFLNALGAFRDPELVQRTLDLVLTDDVPSQDTPTLLSRMLENPGAREATWDFVEKRWKPLRKKITGGLAGRLIAATPALGTTAHRKRVAAHFKKHPIPTAARAVEQALERFDLERPRITRAKAELTAWLADRD